MRLLPLIDAAKITFLRRLSPARAASIETLGFPPFSMRIRDRHRRWFKEKQFHPLKAVGGKREGQDYMRSLGYQVPDRYCELDRITDLPELSDLPPRIVIKPNGGHSAKNFFAIENGHDLIDKSPASRARIIALVGKENSQRFLVEELLQNYDGRPGLPLDYKFHCFGSQIALINVIERNSLTQQHKNRFWYLTNEWTQQHFRVNSNFYQERTTPPMPDCLDDMRNLVRDVGARLNCYVRIDLYATPRGPVFGEFTAFPHMGYGYTPAAEAYFGAMWQGVEGCKG